MLRPLGLVLVGRTSRGFGTRQTWRFTPHVVLLAPFSLGAALIFLLVFCLLCWPSAFLSLTVLPLN
jgi:hypothetical protein